MQLLSLATLLALFLQAAPAAPTTRPDTPEEAAAREAALRFAEAMTGGDPEILKSSFAGSPDDLEALLGLNKLVRAQAHLREAAIAKLPNHGGTFGQGQDQRELARTSVLSCPVEIKGDHATISRPDGQIGYTLVKSGDAWKVEFMPSLADFRRMLPAVEKTCQAVNEVADELQHGRYATESQVRQAISTRIQQLLAAPATPTSKP